ncbi:Ryanodine receptor Ryr|uniref:RyR domain-containing protein n=1 Tax=Dendrosporobacter quercicolus TaxID=146817 RepID=A0A1G9W6V7_9FIRM|nr:RyR domain-containing protein [Dendrosporobacter quercicolus]NSL47709.1 Ryanodine receptor Ryr [Dendrosporobacter quercicolus DSM 1736]SDM79967.1 RyR domain-containing protein [Dendrosporobacter quercicolus]
MPENLTIVVTGDICINRLLWITDPQNAKGLNWQTHENIHSALLPGEALLLTKLVALSTRAAILAPQITDMPDVSLTEFLSSTAELGLFPETADKPKGNKKYRVSRFLGFTGPATGQPKLLPVENDNADADMVIIDDENNGFNSNRNYWPLALTTPGKTPIVLYKMNNPIDTNALWQNLAKHHMNNTIVIINADDLRAKGVNISKSLSWEKTAQDFVWQINNSPSLAFLANCRHLIIPFGLEGAIYYRNEGSKESYLYFLPYAFEGGSVKDSQGRMSGLTSCFVAGLARSIASGYAHREELPFSIGDGIRTGIVAAQKFFLTGFGNPVQADRFPSPAIFSEWEKDFVSKEDVQDVIIRISANADCQSCWYILKDKSSANLAEIAYSIVKNGVKQALKFIPIAQFGKLQTVDRTEIESYRSINNLMSEYIAAVNTVRPLCIAVFGTPGSGKSFGVTEIAASIAPALIRKLNFNLSQLRSPLELINAFHKVRDISLEGKIPLVFFDEFDSAFEGKLGWLKYFLAPMQDGVFRERDSLHPIGKAIFVFAGGTSSTFEEFCGGDISDEQEQKYFLQEFKGAKGPDFLSRLRGYVNILGPNQTDQQQDQLFIIRRAMLLRSLLETKVPQLINDNDEAQIDNGILRALLKIPRYKHESRSMEAILEMSMLNHAKKWEQSYLPSKEQLKMHVDEEQFLRHLMHDAFFSEKIDGISLALHEKLLSLTKDQPEIDAWLRRPWAELDEDIKNAFRNQAKRIPNVLLKINYDVVSVKETPEAIEFTDKELAMLAPVEHKLWCKQQKAAGWRYGPHKDRQQKTDPALVAWEALTEEKRKQMIQMIRIWPEVLVKANFKIERLKFLCHCEAMML